MNRALVLITSLMLVLEGVFGLPGLAQTGRANGTIKVGDWIKYEVIITPVLEGEDSPTWVKFEFTNIEGTNATLKAIMHLTSGEEREYNGTIDVISGSGTGLIIPANSAIGDSVHVAGYENITIESEETLTYTGVNRTAVRASFSNSTDHYSSIWDKQKGIRLENQVSKLDTSTGKPTTTTTIFKINDTNIWQTQLNEYNPYQNVFYLALILVVTAVLVAFLWTRKKKTRHIRKKRSR